MEFNMPLWHAIPDDEELLDLLEKAGCPVACVGEVNETGWHNECRERAARAYWVLRGWLG